jgi:CRISPR-associated endonuclease/helicase Cas3
MIDLGDRAHRAARAKGALRLTHETIAGWPAGEATRQALGQILESSANRLEEDAAGLAADLKTALLSLADDKDTADWLREIARHLAQEPRLDRCVRHHPSDGLIITGKRRLPAHPGADTGFSHEDDAAASGTGRISLHDHLRGVCEFAERFTRHLPALLAADVQLAALCHDLGKADPRFQALLHGGNPWIKGPLLAKSGNLPQGKVDFTAALSASGYPHGGRHELLSVRLVESTPELIDGAHDRELVLHLIASHHGWCRPFAPVVDDAKPAAVSLELNGITLRWEGSTGLERLDSGVAERFWRLIRRYGWWGLAGLESLLMLSDHRCSENEEALPLGDQRD